MATLQDIAALLDGMKPYIAGHGGDIELVKFEQGIVYVKLHGACVTCPISGITIKLGIQEQLREKFPDVKEVVAIE